MYLVSTVISYLDLLAIVSYCLFIYYLFVLGSLIFCMCVWHNDEIHVFLLCNLYESDRWKKNVPRSFQIAVSTLLIVSALSKKAVVVEQLMFAMIDRRLHKQKKKKDKYRYTLFRS